MRKNPIAMATSQYLRQHAPPSLQQPLTLTLQEYIAASALMWELSRVDHFQLVDRTATMMTYGEVWPPGSKMPPEMARQIRLARPE